MPPSPARVGVGLGASCRLGRGHGALQQHAVEAEIDDAQDFEPRQIGIGLDSRSPPVEETTPTGNPGGNMPPLPLVTMR